MWRTKYDGTAGTFRMCDGMDMSMVSPSGVVGDVFTAFWRIVLVTGNFSSVLLMYVQCVYAELRAHTHTQLGKHAARERKKSPATS